MIPTVWPTFNYTSSHAQCIAHQSTNLGRFRPMRSQHSELLTNQKHWIFSSWMKRIRREIYPGKPLWPLRPVYHQWQSANRPGMFFTLSQRFFFHTFLFSTVCFGRFSSSLLLLAKTILWVPFPTMSISTPQSTAFDNEDNVTWWIIWQYSY